MRSTALVALLGGVLLPACAEEQEALIVLRAPAWQAGECVIDGNSMESLGQGILDVAGGHPYLMPAALFNNLQTRSSGSDGVITDEIQLTNVDVDLSSPDNPGVIDDLTVANEGNTSFQVTLASESIPPGETLGVGVEVIGRAASIYLRDNFPMGANVQFTIVAQTVFHGLRSGTNVGKLGEVDSREFSFPIKICNGCLLSCAGCPAIEEDGMVIRPEGECPESYNSLVGGICGNWQDAYYAPVGCDLM